MYVDGYDVRNLPLLARKQILKKLLKYNNLILNIKSAMVLPSLKKHANFIGKGSLQKNLIAFMKENAHHIGSNLNVL